MKKRKRYETREEIISDIESAKLKLTQKMQQAEQLDQDASELFKTGDSYLCSQGVQLRLESKKLKRSAFLLEEKKLPRLKRALAAFDTEPLKMEGNDCKAVILAD